MTVKEIFDLRREGKIEEAYEAVRPMYAVHKGYYTSLCMYLTARDVFNMRLYEGRTEEARKIYEALKRLQPHVEDKDGSVAAYMKDAGERLEGINVIPSTSPVIPTVVEGSLNRGQQAVLDCIKANPGFRVPKIEEATNIPSKSIERHVSVLIAKGLIEHRGSKKAGGYYAK